MMQVLKQITEISRECEARATVESMLCSPCFVPDKAHHLLQKPTL
jgi:hypothetical protein